MSYIFYREKLTSGLSYPLKRSMLEAALNEAGVSTVHTIWFGWPISSGRPDVLSGIFYGDRPRSYAAGLCSMYVRAVPSAERRWAEITLLAGGLPALCRWIRKTESEPETWRMCNHSIAFPYRNGILWREDH